MSTLPGMGDESTWPPYMGHPNDPRRVAPDVCECGVCDECLLFLMDDDPQTVLQEIKKLREEVRRLKGSNHG